MDRVTPNWREFALNCADIIVLAGFAVAQPLLDLLARSTGFLVVRRSQPIDLLLLVALAYAAPAVILIGAELLAALLRPRALAPIHRASLGVLLVLDLLPVIRRTGLPGAVTLLLAVACGTLLAFVYLRIRTWRWSLIYLVPIALLVFPARLLLFSPAEHILFPGGAPAALPVRSARPVPIVLIVFDEFPTASLMDRDGQVDAALYPNFAELARAGTWYRNATSAGESTLIGVPAIVSGMAPDADNPRLPDSSGFPNTLFTLLGGFYRLNVWENNTRLCPASLCGGQKLEPFGERIAGLFQDAGVLWLYTILPADFTRALPDITQSWSGFRTQPDHTIRLEAWTRFDELTDWHDRVQRFREFVASIRPAARPALHFLHILLPHAPWEYLPTGQKYTPPEPRIRGLRGTNDRGEDPNRWTSDAWAVTQNYQQHLLQVGLVDRLIGSLVRHLRDTGLYDPALVIITADHGTSFRPGDSRRSVTAGNHADIMAVPLFVKYPGQRQGGVDDRAAETIDILPTILDVLELRAGWRVDGRSLRDSNFPERRIRAVVTDNQKKLEFPFGLDDIRETVQRKLALFGAAGLYRAGDRYGWTGRPVPASTPGGGLRYELRREGYYANVDPKAPVLLTKLSGRLVGAKDPLPLAVAVNGVVGAVTQSYREGDHGMFSALLPESALRPGRNDISLYLVRGPAELERLSRAATWRYEWGTPLRFGLKGNAAPYYGIGWGAPEPTLTWTDGHAATLDFRASPPPADVELVARICAFTHPSLERQRVRVFVDREEVAQWQVAARFGDYTAKVPGKLFADGEAEVRFELPDAVAPIAVGAGADSRTLGIAVTELLFTR